MINKDNGEKIKRGQRAAFGIDDACEEELIMKNYTYWDEELGSYILTEEGKKLSHRDMVNIIGILEHETKIKNKEVFAIIEWATGIQ